jgi:hypothetical protein
MKTRRRNRPVFITVVSSLLAVDIRLPVGASETPRARDPPLPGRRSHQHHRYGCGGSATANLARKTSPHPGLNQGPPPHPMPNGRGDATTSPLPNAGLAKLVPVTASYDTRRSTCCLPSSSSDLAGPDHWDGQAAGLYFRVSRDPALIIHGEPVGRHACPSQLITHKTLSRLWPAPPAQGPPSCRSTSP